MSPVIHGFVGGIVFRSEQTAQPEHQYWYGSLRRVTENIEVAVHCSKTRRKGVAVTWGFTHCGYDGFRPSWIGELRPC